MMKLGEAANRLSKLDVLAPAGIEWPRPSRTGLLAEAALHSHLHVHAVVGEAGSGAAQNLLGQ